MHLMTNLIGGQPSTTTTSSFRINSCTDISCTTYRFRTKKTYHGCGPGCHASKYWHRMAAYCSSSIQLRKGKVLERSRERTTICVVEA